ncbi:MAG: hypothetical protein RLZZ293_832 [Pseudomonadota bacterium]|jgi:UDP-N-acetylmuramoyl-L-alanyl-D-glutamate--2,6-diaminopimelate ligase
MYSLLNDLINDNILNQLTTPINFLLDAKLSLVIDSRQANSTTAFCAYPGASRDGRDFIAQAISNGCNYIFWDDQNNYPYNFATTNYQLTNLQQYCGILAAAIANYPSRRLQMFAITGTNGKTSISHWLNQAFNYLGLKSGIIGTTGIGIYPNISELGATTPDPISLQQYLATFSQQQVNCVAMEVSSHALVQGRVNGIEFDYAIFTNLTQDHLDYHQTMENYYQAKRQLFYWHNLTNAIINSDDSYGIRLLNELNHEKNNLNIISYGLVSGDLRASNVHLTRNGMEFTLSYLGQQCIITTKLIGKFNVYNLLAVLASLVLAKVEFEQLPIIAQQLTAVTGRMEIIPSSRHALSIVDFAHTPDALANVLQTLSELKGTGKLWCIFGCGGNRDHSKRPLMGRIASQLADRLIITTDNPRYENPQQIISEIAAGVANISTSYYVIEDRKEAIEYALTNASSDDTILIAGKGHENYQEILGEKYYFSDIEIVKQFITGK